MFKTLMLTALLPCLSGGLTQNQPSSLSIDEDSSPVTITLTAIESQQCLQHFYNEIDTHESFEDIILRYDESILEFFEMTSFSVIYNDANTNYSLNFILDSTEYFGEGNELKPYNYYFVTEDDEFLAFDLVLVNDGLTNVNAVYQALELDLPPTPPYTNILQEIITILVSGITGIATGLGNGVSQLVSSTFIANGHLSIFGGVVIAFAGLGLAVGLSRWVMNFLTSLGKKD